MSAYPPDVSGAALCYVDGGHRWSGGGVCTECGERLRCGCGQYVREDAMDDHLRVGVCRLLHPCPFGCECADDCDRQPVCAFSTEEDR